MGKLKETGTTHWLSPNTGATNETGFTALPGGYRSSNGNFSNVGGTYSWWSSSEGSTGHTWSRSMYYNGGDVDRGESDKRDGFSILKKI